MTVRFVRLSFAALLFLATTIAASGCGGGNEKAVIPENFTPKPDKAPSIGGVPGGGAKKDKDKGGATNQ